MALIYKDTVMEIGCRCNLNDAQKSKIDPTGTSSIRTAMQSTLAIRWRRVKTDLRNQLITRDILGASATSQMSSILSMAGSGADRIEIFTNYISNLIDTHIVNIDSDIQGYVARAYAKGIAFGMKNVDSTSLAPMESNQRIKAFVALTTKVELRGIADAVTQAATRIVANGILQQSKPVAIMRAIFDRIEKVGISRTNAMVSAVIIGAFTDASLTVYEAAGHEAVGLIPEHLLRASLTTDARKASKKKSKVKRTGKAAAKARKLTAKKIAEAEKANAKLEKLGRVRVITAEDDDVCVVCEKIADGGPYNINTARALIPAHPHCRCAFVPVDIPKTVHPVEQQKKAARPKAKKTAAKKPAKKAVTKKKTTRKKK